MKSGLAPTRSKRARQQAARSALGLLIALSLVWSSAPPAVQAAADAGSPGASKSHGGSAAKADKDGSDARSQKTRKRKKRKRRVKKRKRNQLMSPAVSKKLTEAQELITSGKAKAAKKVLAATARRRGLKPIEVANIYYLQGYVANAEDEPEKAIAYFKRAMKLDVLPYGTQYNLEYTIAQLYMMEGDFEKARRMLVSWFRKVLAPDSPVTPNGSNYYMLALTYMQIESMSEQERAERARKPAEIAIRSDEPQESWLRLLAQIYYVLRDYPKLAETLETLITRWPKPEYYTQLSGAYAESGEELKSLAVLQLAYQQGLLVKPAQLKHLAQSYMFHEIPYQAGLVLQKGIEDGVLPRDKQTYELLGDAWLMAQESDRAFEPLEEAARLDDDGELYMRLAQAYVQAENWAEADRVLGLALEKGLETPGTAHLLRGLARMYLHRWTAARSSFAAAERFEDQAHSAEQYKRYLEQLKQQSEALAS